MDGMSFRKRFIRVVVAAALLAVVMLNITNCDLIASIFSGVGKLSRLPGQGRLVKSITYYQSRD